MKIQLENGESLVKQGLANHFKGPEAVGGKLYLTNKRIIFKSHPINIQRHEESIYLDKIQSIGKRNTLFMVPNGIYIKYGDKEERFVVNKRDIWLSEIQKHIDNSIIDQKNGEK